METPGRVLLKQFYQSIGSKINLAPPESLFEKPDRRSFKKRKRHIKKFKKDPNSEKDAEKMEQYLVTVPAAVDNEDSNKECAAANSECKDEQMRILETPNGSSECRDKNTASTADPEPCGSNLHEPSATPSGNSEPSGSKLHEPSATAEPEPGGNNLDETITLTQIQEKYKFVGETSESEVSDEDDEQREKRLRAKKLKKQRLQKKEEEKKKRKRLFTSPLILVQSLKVSLLLLILQILSSMHYSYYVFYAVSHICCYERLQKSISCILSNSYDLYVV